MAELITEIISQEAFNQVKQMDANLAKLVKQFEDSARAAMLINEALKGSEGLGPLNDGLGGTTKAANNLEKAIKQLNVARSEEGKEIQRVRTETSLLNAETRKAEKDAIQSANAYKMLSLQHREATETAKKLGAQLGVTSKEFQTAAALANKYDQQLKAIDSGLGNYKRNVGNYASATMSLSQVFRELPAFTYSAQTGILGISNNLPILADQFKKVKEETGSTGAALRVFGRSIFSMGNIFTIALGLFTIYSKEIFSFIKGTKEAAATTEDLANAMKSSTESVSKEIVKVEQLYFTATNLNASYKSRKLAVDELQKLYPSYLGNLKDEAIMAGQASEAYNSLTNALINKAMYEGISAQAAEVGKGLAPLLVELDKVNKKIDAVKGPKGKSINGYFISGQQSAQDVGYLQDLEMQAESLRNQITPIQGQLKSLFSAASNYGDLSVGVRTPTGSKANTKAGAKAEADKAGSGYLESVTERLKKEIELRKKSYDEYLALVKENLDAQQVMFDKADKAKIDADNMYTEVVMSNMDAQQQLFDKYDKEQQDAFQAKIDSLQATASIINSLTSVLNDISSLQFDIEMERINKKDKALDESYKSDLRRLESSGKSKEQIEKDRQLLEAQTEAQRKLIDKERAAAARKKAQSDRASDIANIITGTALAVVNALGSKPYTPLNIALAAAAGATGAAQLARAIATPLPSYEKGTQNHPGGYAQVSEAGQELVIQPDGTKYLTPKRKSIIHLPKGSKVIPNNELIKSAQNAAMIKLAGMGNSVTTDSYGEALIDSFENKIEKLIKVTERKNTNVSVNLYGGFENYVKSNMM